MSRSKSKRRDSGRIATRSVPLTTQDLRIMDNIFEDTGLRPINTDQDQLLRNYQDRRRWEPGPQQAVRVARRPSRLMSVFVRPVQKKLNTISGKRYVTHIKKRLAREIINFMDPDRTLICLRRRIRTQVLHARKKTGRGGQRKPKWNYWSSIKCKRR